MDCLDGIFEGMAGTGEKEGLVVGRVDLLLVVKKIGMVVWLQHRGEGLSVLRLIMLGIRVWVRNILHTPPLVICLK